MICTDRKFGGSWGALKQLHRRGLPSRAGHDRRAQKAPRSLTRAAYSSAISLLLFALLFLAAPSPLSAKPLFGEVRYLSVERIYSAPSLSGYLTDGVEWEPDSQRISYFDSDDYGQDIATLDVQTGKNRVLIGARVLAAAMPPLLASAIQPTGLGRVQAARYLWSPLGNALLLIGTDKLALLDLDTMTPRTLVDSSDSSDRASAQIDDPKFSPDGQWVSFVRGWNLWIANVDTGQLRQLTTAGSEALRNGDLDWLYPEELDCSTAYWWSPDSSKIAYYQMDERPVERYPIMDMISPVGAIFYTRFPEAGTANPIVKVGVVAISGGATHTTQWMDTGADTNVYLPRVVWLRDSRRVAVERLNRAQNRLDLLFCDAATGASQDVLTETDPYWINIADDLYFPLVQRTHRLSPLLSLRSFGKADRAAHQRKLADQRKWRLRPRRGQPSDRG